MKVGFGSGFFAALVLAPAFAHEGRHHHGDHYHHGDHHHGTHHHGNHHHGMKSHEAEFANRPHSHIMYHHVEKECAADVAKLCEEKEQARQLPQSTGDPLLDWIFLPSAQAPPELMDFTRLMDRMFDPVFLQPTEQHITLFFVEEPQHAPHFLVDSVAAKVAEQSAPEEIPQLATDLQAYGKEMIGKFPEHTFEQRVARRLSEVDATTIQHHVRLPFGCPKNRCLREAALAGEVSKECASSIERLESTFELEGIMEQRNTMFVGMLWAYAASLIVVLMLLAKRLRSQQYDRRLGMRILQTIYSNPELKRQVERELGQSVGYVPPVPTFVLRTMTAGGAELKRRIACMKRTHMAVFLSLLTLAFVSPFWVLPICICLSFLRVIHLCLLPSQSNIRECECCCCGANTTDAAAGNLTAEQECCNCCKGTGVCSTACSSCCGGCCCCGGEDCCCCEGDSAKGACKINAPEVADDCTCCCCAATPSLARAGTLTEEQECCNCCKGTGVCSDACASCCGGCCCCGGEDCCCCEGDAKVCELKGRGQKHVVPARTQIFEGVPMQVV